MRMGGSNAMKIKKEFEYETPRLDFEDGLHRSFKIIQHCVENNIFYQDMIKVMED